MRMSFRIFPLKDYSTAGEIYTEMTHGYLEHDLCPAQTFSFSKSVLGHVMMLQDNLG